MATVTAPQPGLTPPPSPAERLADRVDATRRRAAGVPTWLWIGGGLIALMALSAYLRSRYLVNQLWMDEAITTGISLHPFTDIPHVLRYDGNPPLYYMLLHLWMQGFGDSEAGTHSLSLVAGVLTIPVGFWGADRMFGRRAAMMAALLFAFNAWLTAYAQETRMYELVGLEGTVATVGYVGGFVDRRRGYLFLFGAALLAMLYTHSWGVFFFVGSALALVPALRAAEDRRRFVRDVVITYGIALVLYLPWVPTLLFQVAHTAAPWDRPPRLGAPVQISRNLLGGDRITAVLVLSGIVGFGPLFTRRYRGTRDQTLLWTLIALPVAVLLIAWIASQRNPAWAPRYFAPVLASLLFLIAWGCSRARVLGWVAILLGVWYLHDPAAFAPKHKSNLREVGAEIGPRLHPGDIVVVGQPEQTPLNWYYLPAGLRFTNTANHGRILADPRYMNWVDALDNLKSTQPVPALNRLLSGMRPGQQLVFSRPLTEGAQNWRAPWTVWVRRRSAQWAQALTNDVSRGLLTPVTYAPNNYADACCVADSTVLYRRTARPLP
jgi:mannosyltransferase